MPAPLLRSACVRCVLEDGSETRFRIGNNRRPLLRIPLPDAFLARMTLPDLLTILGLSLWCFVAALELMRRRAQKN